ncbi:MAG TPA: choice-of-anchor G family protein, partial [Microbacterium sp.]|nr:choice-of-anchor G family protein [Microbacterium sp.]
MRKTKWSPALRGGALIGVTALMSFGTLSAVNAAAGDDSESLGAFLGADLAELNAADLAYAYASNPGGPPLDTDPFNLAALELLALDLELVGDGLLQVPLITDGSGPGILDLGEAGTLNSYASSPSTTQATAASGLVADDGTIAVSEDADPADHGTATINLTDLLDQLGVDAVTEELIDEVELEVGALASRASDAAGSDPTSDYRVGDLGLEVESPIVAELSQAIRTALSGVADDLTADLNGLVAADGVINTLLDGIDLDVAGLASLTLGEPTVAVTVGDLAAAIDTALGENAILVSDDGSVEIDLTDGTIEVDLAEIVNPGGPNLNGLPANTSVLTAETISMITAGVTNALGKIVTPITNAVAQVVNETSLTVSVQVTATAGIPPLVPTQTVIDAPITISGTLAQLATGNGTIDADVEVLPDLPLGLGELVSALLGDLTGTLTDQVAQPVLDALGPLVLGIVDATAAEVTGALDLVIDGVLELLDPALDGLLSNIV